MLPHANVYVFISEQSEWSLNEAKRRVEDEYLVVGFLEDLEGSLRVMEKLAPSLFNGLVKDSLIVKTWTGGKTPGRLWVFLNHEMG